MNEVEESNIFIEFFMDLSLVCLVCNPYMVYVVCVCVGGTRVCIH